MDEDKETEEKKIEEKSPGEHHERNTIIVTAVVTILAIAFIGGLIYLGKNYRDRKKELQTLKDQMENMQKGTESPGEVSISGEAAASATPATETATDEYAGWKTYINSEIGYTLKYPADWTVKEIDQFSELLNENVKYITLTTPNKKYFFHWGLKQKTDTFAISDRTGMGAGDFQKDGKAMILGKEYDITRFIFKGKTKEVFYPSSGLTQTADGKYDFVATLSYGSGSNYDALDIDSIPEKSITEKILKSVTLSARSASTGGCPKNFTNEENLNKADWKNYKNSKYGYSFEYPKEWTITDQENKRVAIEDAGNNIYFSWNSEEMTAFDYMGYKITSEKNSSVACQNTKKTFLSGDPTADPPGEANGRIIFADFKNNGKRHLLAYSYLDFGASISSDLIEQFNLLLKTIKFNK
jgi:hypothetical protein